MTAQQTAPVPKAAATPSMTGLGVRPARFQLARPGVAELVARPLVEDHPTRSTPDDLDCGLYLPVPGWEVAVYRIRKGDNSQTGVLLEVAVADYDAGRIRPHESTRPHAVRALADHLHESGVDTAPVTLALRSDREAAKELETLTRGDPFLEVVTADAVEHAVWLVNVDEAARVLDRVATTPVLYIVDGHHRCEAASRLASRPVMDPAADADHHLFALVVPAEQLTVASFHVVIHEVEQDPRAVVDGLAAHLGGRVHPVDESAAAATSPGMASLWYGQRWYRLTLGTEPRSSDAASLQDLVLRPVFRIAHPETDRRLEHVPGTVTLAELRQRCPRRSAALVLHPPTVACLLDVADDGRSVPPKSSFFHPKVPAGLFVRPRRDSRQWGRTG